MQAKRSGHLLCKCCACVLAAPLCSALLQPQAAKAIDALMDTGRMRKAYVNYMRILQFPSNHEAASDR